MSKDVLHIRPPFVDGLSKPPVGRDEVMAYIDKAVAAGELVTVSSTPILLTPAQVARALGVSRPTISRRISNGTLKSVRVGSHHRIPYAELLRFWKEQMTELVSLQADDIWEELPTT